MTLMILAMVAFWAACTTAPYSNRKQLMLIPPQQLDAMGAQAFDAMLQQAPTANDAQLENYVKCITDPIIEVAARDHENSPKQWRLAVFKDANPNAFALPGGNIGVHTGLLKVAKTDAQLAAVLGHELGHVLAAHSGERVSQQVAAQGGLALAQGFLLSKAAPEKQRLLAAALGLGAQVGVLLPFGRKQESEADMIGLHLMAKAGYDPAQSVELWKNMIEATGGKQPPQFLSTHPAPQNRITKLQEEIPKVMDEYKDATNQKARAPASAAASTSTSAKSASSSGACVRPAS